MTLKRVIYSNVYYIKSPKHCYIVGGGGSIGDVVVVVVVLLVFFGV